MSEMPSSACEGCGFFEQGCTVPGGVCGRRLIHGTRRTVWHVLEEIGLAKQDPNTGEWEPTGNNPAAEHLRLAEKDLPWAGEPGSDPDSAKLCLLLSIAHSMAGILGQMVEEG